MPKKIKSKKNKKTLKEVKTKRNKPNITDGDDLIHDMGKNTSPMPSDDDGERKVKFAGEFDCPHCGFRLKIEAGDIIETPAVAAVKKPYIDVTRSAQTKLATDD